MEGGVVLVVALVEQPADLVYPALAVVALDPALLHLRLLGSAAQSKKVGAQNLRIAAYEAWERVSPCFMHDVWSPLDPMCLALQLRTTCIRIPHSSLPGTSMTRQKMT